MDRNQGTLTQAWDQLVAIVAAYLYTLRSPLTYEVRVHEAEGNHRGEVVVVFIGVVEEFVADHPNFPAGRYEWRHVKTFYGVYEESEEDGTE